MPDVEHFWPGLAITDLPYNVTYDTFFVDAMSYQASVGPDLDARAYHIPGYDFGAPWVPSPPGFPDNSGTRTILQGPEQGAPVIWSILGSGEDVNFDAVTTGNGLVMYLMVPNAVGVAPYNERGLVNAASTPNVGTHAGFHQVLTAGVTYYLAVFSYGQVGTGSGGQLLFGQGYTVSITFHDGHSGPVAPTAAPANDLRTNATNVVIPESGDGTYLSVDTTLSYATPGSVESLDEDPPDPDSEATPLYQTCWWKYVPTQLGSATLRAHSSPADDVHVTAMILRGDLSAIHAGMVGTDIIFPVNAGDVYYIALGTITPSYSVSVSFGLNGPPTTGDVTPDPTGDLPPFDPGADPFTPDTPQVPTVDATKETKPLIDLIRDFSSKVKKAVRVISVDTVPDPSAPLIAPFAIVELVNRSAPNTMQSMDPETLYSAATDIRKAGENKVSMLGANNLREASATLVNNDATILLSYWQIPDFLPLATVNGQPATFAPVQSVTFTFDDSGFSGELEFFVG